jgi:hypothetical protein
VTIAGRRWTIEENIQAGKGLAGLDEHQVRTWTSWHRWVTLAMLAAAFLTIAAAADRRRSPQPDGQIPLTRNEIATLFASLIIKPPDSIRHRLRWSTWRRRHQYRAQQCHDQRQAAHDQDLLVSTRVSRQSRRRSAPGGCRHAQCAGRAP